MAFKMKGMEFGKGTQNKSPQKMKAEAAMKMQREAAMKMAKNSAMDMAKDPMKMAKDPMKMKKGSAMDMAEKSPMKAAPLLPVLYQGGKQVVKKGAKQLAKNKKVQQKIIKPVTRKLAPVIKKANCLPLISCTFSVRVIKSTSICSLYNSLNAFQTSLQSLL